MFYFLFWNKSRRRPADVKTARHTACCHWKRRTARTRANRGALAEPIVNAAYINKETVPDSATHNASRRSSWQQLFEWQRMYPQHPEAQTKLDLTAVSSTLYKHYTYLNIHLPSLKMKKFSLFLHYEVTSFGLEFCEQTCLLFSVHTHTHIGEYWQHTKVSSPGGCCWSKVGYSIFTDIELTFLSSCFDLITSLSTCCVSTRAIDSASVDHIFIWKLKFSSLCLL